MAGLDAESVQQTTVVNWMLLGVYFTQEFLFTMRKTKSPICLGCDHGVVETLNHIILHCGHYNSIREAYLPQYLEQNKFISEILDVEDKILLSILDPLSSKLPDSVTKSWLSPNHVYKLSRQLCFNIHSKRKKLYDNAKKLS